VVRTFDLVALGTGSAAATAAWKCRAAGWKVAIVDSRPFGGTCALRGCDPKKVLVGAAEVIDWARRMEGNGIRAEGAKIDWRELMRFKRTFTEPVPEAREQSMVKAGIATFHGRARFVGPRTVQVGSEQLEGRAVVIATGARPATIGLPGAEHVIFSDQFLELDELPRRIAFVGGGYISFEFAHVAARTGAQVTILHRGARPLEGFDPDLVEQLVQRSRKLGIDLRLKAAVERIDKGPSGLTVRASGGVELQADLVVHGAGRVPEIDDLGLEAAGIERERGVKVNDFLQSVSNPSVYAAGDAAQSGGKPLTPVAGYDGGIVAANLLKGNHRKPDFSGIPSVVFTVPPLASVGLSERAARERNLKFHVNHQSTVGWYSSRRTAEDTSGFKVLIDDDSGAILGAHLLGSHAEEVINLFALAIRQRLRAADLRDALFAYPTHASDVAYMLD
jgi:glutathione reductase (NADPH)